MSNAYAAAWSLVTVAGSVAAAAVVARVCARRDRQSVAQAFGAGVRARRRLEVVE